MAKRETFDVDIVRVCRRDPGTEAHHLIGIRNPQFWKEVGFTGADLSLEEAKKMAELLDLAGGAGLVVPAIYRAPLISQASARQIAEARLSELRHERGDVFGPLEDGHEQDMWWRFLAVHLPSQAEEREPGCVYIDVDKVDGHIKTRADVDEYAEWQK